MFEFSTCAKHALLRSVLTLLCDVSEELDVKQFSIPLEIKRKQLGIYLDVFLLFFPVSL